MDRRNFVLASGSAVLSGSMLSTTKRPTIGVEFKLQSKKLNIDPDMLNSLLVEFDRLKLTTKYLDESDPMEVKVRVNLEDGSSAEKTVNKVNFRNGETINLINKFDISSITVDGINTNDTYLIGNIKVIIDHPEISKKSYSEQFSISGGGVSIPRTDHLKVHYTFNDGTADNQVLNEYHGNPKGDPQYLSSGGPKEDGAFDFDGSGDYLQPKSSNDMVNTYSSNTGPFTFSMWVNMDNYGSKEELYNARGNRIRIEYRDSGGIDFDLYDGGFTSTPRIQPTENVWEHWVARYDSSNSPDMSLVRNADFGDEVTASFNSSIQQDIREELIMKDYRDSAADGKLDNFMFWNVALTDSEVEQLYNAQLS